MEQRGIGIAEKMLMVVARIKSEFRAHSRAVHQKISQKCQQKTKAN